MRISVHFGRWEVLVEKQRQNMQQVSRNDLAKLLAPCSAPIFEADTKFWKCPPKEYGCSEGIFFPGIAKQVLFESDFCKTSRPSFLKMVL